MGEKEVVDRIGWGRRKLVCMKLCWTLGVGGEGRGVTYPNIPMPPAIGKKMKGRRRFSILLEIFSGR